MDEYPQNLEVNWQAFCWGQALQTARSLEVGARQASMAGPCAPRTAALLSLMAACSQLTLANRPAGQVSAMAFPVFLKRELLLFLTIVLKMLTVDRIGKNRKVLRKVQSAIFLFSSVQLLSCS